MSPANTSQGHDGRDLEANRIAYHIARLGCHFRNIVVDRACRFLGYHNRGLRMVPNGRPDVRNRRKPFTSSDDELAGLSRDQRQKRVGDAIRELFPLIPDQNVEQIFKRSFGEVRDNRLPLKYVLANDGSEQEYCRK